MSEQELTYEELKQHNTKMAKAIERLGTWVNDLQSGMYINCVYCGHRYGPKDEIPTAMADVLKEHVAQCPDHPMSKLRVALERIAKFGLERPSHWSVDTAKEALAELEEKREEDPDKNPTSPRRIAYRFLQPAAVRRWKIIKEMGGELSSDMSSTDEATTFFRKVREEDRLGELQEKVDAAWEEQYGDE